MIDEVVSVKKVNIKSKRYDLTIKDNNNFYANDILVHNCQNIPWVLQDEDSDWYTSEKIDGQSATYWYKKNGWFGFDFGICSRTVRKFELDNSNWSRVARELEIKKKLKEIYKHYGELAIQGEIIGSNIQGNKYRLAQGEYKFFVFNVYSISQRIYLPIDLAQTVTKQMGLTFVPVLGIGIKLPKTVDECLEFVKGYSCLPWIADKKVIREGIVFRKFDKSKSFKCVNNDWLLNNKE